MADRVPETTQFFFLEWQPVLVLLVSDNYVDKTSVVRLPSGSGPHEEMDQRAIACFAQALEDVGFATDVQRRLVLHHYFAWAAIPPSR